MALDRLSRNVQFASDHKINVDVMRRFLPTFDSGNAKKQAKFEGFAFDAATIKMVQDMWDETFPQSVPKKAAVSARGAQKKRK